MSKRHQRDGTEITYSDACELLAHALSNGTRGRILDVFDECETTTRAAERLRTAMRSHTFMTSRGALRLQRIVQSFDTRTRRVGLHVLESWDYVAHRFASEITPVLMLDRCAIDRVPPDGRRAAMAVLLDHYFLSVLGLIAARAWDDGDPNANLDRADALLTLLQETDSSGRRFVSDVETLLLTSVSHYHPEEHAYEALTLKFASLTGEHRRRMATTCCAVLGGHLRWGMRFMYGRDVARMRADNTVDFPFLVYGLSVMLGEYEALQAATTDIDRVRVVEALANGLSADPWFAIGRTPDWLRVYRDEHRTACDRLLAYRDILTDDMAELQPTPRAYSPLGFDCNFLCNTVTAMVATGLADPGPHPPLNALFTRTALDGWPSDAADRQAQALMTYAHRNRSERQAPLIVYDPHEAAHAYNLTVRVLRESRVDARYQMLDAR